MKEKTIVVDGARVVGSSKWWAELNEVFEKMAEEKARVLADRKRKVLNRKQAVLARKRSRAIHRAGVVKYRKEYRRKWYLANRERIAAIQKKYRASRRA